MLSLFQQKCEWGWKHKKEKQQVMIPWLFDCRKYKRPNMAECDIDLALHQ